MVESNKSPENKWVFFILGVLITKQIISSGIMYTLPGIDIVNLGFKLLQENFQSSFSLMKP